MAEEVGIPLRTDRLEEVARHVPTPSYDRTRVKTGVVHLGVGSFHRAHQAMYLDRLLAAGASSDWAICGVGVLPGDAAMRDVLKQQDGLYTLVVKSADGTWAPRVIGSIVDYLFAPDDPGAVIERLADRATRIVTLTMTEGGYNFNQATGEFDATQPDVVHDLAPGCRPTHRVRPPDRWLGAQARARYRAVHGLVLRQHPAQRPGGAPGAHGLRAVARPGAGGLDGARGPLPQLHGRPHHACHHRQGPRRGAISVRDRRCLAGGLRTLHAMGPRG